MPLKNMQSREILSEEKSGAPVRVGVAVIVHGADGRVLIGRRRAAHGQGLWGFPGGHLETGERPEDCARREAMEEVGIEISNPRLVGVTNDIFDSGKHYITLFMACEHAGGIVTNCEPDKLEGWEWHPMDALPRPRFDPINALLSDPLWCTVVACF